MITVQLNSLRCIEPSRKTDEVYFEHKVENSNNSLKIPNAPSDDHTWHIKKDQTIYFQEESELDDGTIIAGAELIFNFNEIFTINLMDYDKVSSDDLLASIKFDVNSLPSSPQTLSSEDNDIIYEIAFSYLQ